MEYPVLHTFQEKEHKNTIYKVGETYPKNGFKTKAARVKHLQSDDNKYKKAFLGPELNGKEDDKGIKE